MAANNLLTARATRYGAYATVYTLIVLAALGMVNWLANRHNRSVDTTANKRYSLSEQTQKLVRDLKQPLRISYYALTREFPAARDLLDRYDNLSNRVSVAYVDPEKKPQAAIAAGVKRIGTLFLESGGKKEEAKGLSEEEITGALVRLIKGGTRTVCSVSGSGEHQLDETGNNGYSSLQQVLQQDAYQVRSISLLERAEIPRDCTAVLIGGPKFDYAEPIVNTLKSYVEGGGRALFLLDPPLQSGTRQTPENPALVQMLANWGVTANKNLVLDNNPFGQLTGVGPEVPLVTSYESHPIVREMTRTATGFPITRSLEVKSAGSSTVESLLKSSANSEATTDLAQPTMGAESNQRGPLTLAAAGTYNTGKENSQGRFVVVGSSSWVANSFLPFNGNRDLALNMMNWLSSDEDLISIRPKDPEDRRLTLTRGQTNTLFFTSVLLLPLAVVGAGLRVWWQRR